MINGTRSWLCALIVGSSLLLVAGGNCEFSECPTARSSGLDVEQHEVDDVREEEDDVFDSEVVMLQTGLRIMAGGEVKSISASKKKAMTDDLDEGASSKPWASEEDVTESLVAVNHSVELGSGLHSEAVVEEQLAVVLRSVETPPALICAGVYVLVFLVTLVCMLSGLHYMPSWFRGKQKDYLRFETHSWNSGFIYWFRLDWAPIYFTKWWSYGRTRRIRPEELGPLGCEEDEAASNAAWLSEMWSEDLRKRGNRGNNMLWCIFRFATVRKFMLLLLQTFISELCTWLVPTIAIQYSTNALVDVGTRYMIDPNAPIQQDALIPVIAAILFFTGSPVLCCTMKCSSFLIGYRLHVKLTSALTALVYQKSQRLPLAMEDDDLLPDHEKENLDWGKQKEGTLKQKYSVVSLCNQDCGETINGFFVHLASVLSKVTSMIVLATLLVLHLGGWVSFIGILLMLSAGLIVVPVFLMIRTKHIMINHYAGMRLSFLQEQFYNIRLIKAYGWEEAVEKISSESRVHELREMRYMLMWMTVRELYQNFYPRLIVFTCLGLYMWFNWNDMDGTDIFLTIQITTAFRVSVVTLFAVVPTMWAVIPSIKRVDLFMKLPECPWPKRDSDEHRPAWIKPVDMTPAASPQQGASQDGPCIRAKGSFSWQASGQATLKDVNLQLRPGEKVAVVGEVGSGKSTLLHVLLAELWAQGDSVLEVPRRAAYSGQTPHIIEGTLRDNVLFHNEMNQERYDKALFAACLEPDLKVLPNGDLVPIGSRGIVLSGGQKARVSLARAAYREDCQLVLVDDPFSAVDYPTGNHIMNHCIAGEIMDGRTVVVIVQPDNDRIHRFDRVILMAGGTIVADGPPSELTQELAYQRLLDKYQKEMVAEEKNNGKKDFKREAKKPAEEIAKMDQLRDEEIEESDLSWSIMKQLLGVAGWTFFFGSQIAVAGNIFANLMADLCMANMTNQLTLDYANGRTGNDRSSLAPFMWAGAAWWMVTCAVGFLKSMADTRGCVNLSVNLYRLIIHRLLRAPIDFFYDKTPVGRIMNRLSTDVLNIDFWWFGKICQVFSQCFTYFIPLLFIHFVCPTYFSVMMVPFYYALAVVCKAYWAVTIPLKHLNILTRSRVNSCLSDAETGHATVRGYGSERRLADRHLELTDDMQKAGMIDEVCKTWLQTRCQITLSFMPTSVMLIGLLYPQILDVGISVMCLIQILTISGSMDQFMETTMTMQMEMISMHRLHEYMTLVQEKPARKEGDVKLQGFDIKLSRKALGTLEANTSPEGTLKIVRVALPQRAKKDSRWQRLRPLGETPGNDLSLPQPHEILSQVAGKSCFEAKFFGDLDPTNEDLAKASATWHRVTAVNGKEDDAKELAEELCFGTSLDITLSISSTWMANGARVVIKDLVAGYANIPTNILKGVNLVIEPKTKVGVMGSTGCGKSTLMNCCLRTLEPRKGKIEYDGVNILEIGTTTLRRAIGLVPQDPIMFSGTIRSNLDPFNEHTDDQIWAALEKLELDKFVKSQQGLLHFQVKSDGGNLSSGERQLFCIARMVLRRPQLLFLDEATSAIDPANQERVCTMLRTSFEDCTIMAVAHRLETVLDYDVAIVMDQGVIVEQGRIEELKSDPTTRIAKMFERFSNAQN